MLSWPSALTSEQPDGTFARRPGSSCPLPVGAALWWPYAVAYTSSPTVGQSPADVSALWQRTARLRTTPDTWPPDFHTAGSLRPADPVTQSLLDCPWPQLLVVTSYAVAWPPRCWPWPTRRGQPVSAALVLQPRALSEGQR